MAAIISGSFMDRMYFILTSIKNAETLPHATRFEIFCSHLPAIVFQYSTSQILHPDAIRAGYAFRLFEIFKLATRYFPGRVDSDHIILYVSHLKNLQDSVSNLISNSSEILELNHMYHSVASIAFVCDSLIVKMMYLYESDVVPFKHHQLFLHNTTTSFMRTFLNVRYVFFAYSYLGGYSRMPHIYLHLTKGSELQETTFLFNCRSKYYFRRSNWKCQICCRKIDIYREDVSLLGYCGHFYCTHCSDWEPSYRHKLPCVDCKEYSTFWIKKSFLFTTWRISADAEKVFKVLSIPTTWYVVVPEPFYDVNCLMGPENHGFPISFSVEGYLGSRGCNNLVPVVHREYDSHEIESNAAFEKRIEENAFHARTNRKNQLEWIMKDEPDRLSFEIAPPPPSPPPVQPPPPQRRQRNCL